MRQQVAGDLNDVEFSDTLSILKTGSDLVNLIDAQTFGASIDVARRRAA